MVVRTKLIYMNQCLKVCCRDAAALPVRDETDLSVGGLVSGYTVLVEAVARARFGPESKTQGSPKWARCWRGGKKTKRNTYIHVWICECSSVRLSPVPCRFGSACETPAAVTRVKRGRIAVGSS